MYIVRLYPFDTGDPELYPFLTPEDAQAFCDRVNALPDEDRAYLLRREEPKAHYWELTPCASAEAGWEELSSQYNTEGE